MKTQKELRKVFDNAKGDNRYYDFNSFVNDAHSFLRVMRKQEMIASMYVSKGGMLRRFNTLKHNMLLNICYNNKKSWDPVVVKGCGMDMFFHLLFTVCETLTTNADNKKVDYNSLSSRYTIL